LNVPDLIGKLSRSLDSRPSGLQVFLNYIYTNLVWSIVPAFCGVVTAVTIDRPSRAYLERGISGLLGGGIMGTVALLAGMIIDRFPSLAGDPQIFVASQVFVFVLYGGLGFVLGFILPSEIKRYRAAQEKRLPDKISVLRAAVVQYFYDIQQFSEWLNSYEVNLQGKRPLDVLAEDSGLQQLTSFVVNTRTKVSPAAA
jgi:hypothetical protein